MSQILRRQTVIFVVRVWAEYLEQDPPLWRGEILRSDGSQLIHFHNLDEILTFIELEASHPHTSKENHHGS